MIEIAICLFMLIFMKIILPIICSKSIDKGTVALWGLYFPHQILFLFLTIFFSKFLWGISIITLRLYYCTQCVYMPHKNYWQLKRRILLINHIPCRLCVLYHLSAIHLSALCLLPWCLKYSLRNMVLTSFWSLSICLLSSGI